MQDQLDKEAKRYQDLVQEDFIDSYKNLTMKSVKLLSWSYQTCAVGSQGTQYVLKTDEDMYINLSNLWQIVTENKEPHLLVGTLMFNKYPVNDKASKYYVPENPFANGSYPNYLLGASYLNV